MELTHKIEKCFYQHKYREPLEREHHFPRHNQLSDRGTLSKLISILSTAFKLKGYLSQTGNLTAIKKELLKKF